MRVAIVGARADGTGKVVLDILRRGTKHTIEEFVDDNPDLHGKALCGIRIEGGVGRLLHLQGGGLDGVAIAIGSNSARLRVSEKVLELGLELVSAIDPSAVVAAEARIGRGVMVGALAVIAPGADVGDLAIIGSGAVVDHDCVIGTGAQICSGCHLAGRVTVCTGAFVGIGACVIPDITIGEWATVGAGAAVIDNVPPNVTVVGVPARALEQPPGQQ